MIRDNSLKIDQLPDTTSMENEILIQNVNGTIMIGVSSFLTVRW
ncbi:MAG: hypothetical protein VCF25_02030 [Candidatus Poribacteria bacterium]